MRIAIFGTGGMGRETYDIASAAGLKVVFVVDQPNGPLLGVPVIEPCQLEDDDQLILAIGSSQHRRTLAERFAGRTFANLYARTSVVSPSALIGEGSVVCDYAVINNSAVIGRQFQANTFAQVSHDCVIGDYVTFAPRVSCNGNVHVEDGAFIGAGAVIRHGSPSNPTVIGAGAVVGMGAVVTKSVPAGATVMGNPAAPFREATIP